MIPYHINEPFWGGWKIYGWEKSIPGIGLKKEMVEKQLLLNEKITVTIGKDKTTVYAIDPQTVIDYIKKKNSIFKARFGTILYVIPQNIFTVQKETL